LLVNFNPRGFQFAIQVLNLGGKIQKPRGFQFAIQVLNLGGKIQKLTQTVCLYKFWGVIWSRRKRKGRVQISFIDFRILFITKLFTYKINVSLRREARASESAFRLHHLLENRRKDWE
jgi:hypothetical protein